jgi:hypothetical protein
MHGIGKENMKQINKHQEECLERAKQDKMKRLSKFIHAWDQRNG